ncbi:MAG: ankyrin repeat domain-containing protein [Acidobacteria bacterium]|nr:ankyrin repeat domain-containing protein [Acidobacteriota bacterium]
MRILILLVAACGLLFGSTPLFLAVDRGDLDAVRLLIDRGANLNVKDTFYNATPLGWALRKKYDGIVRLLIERGADLADVFAQSIRDNDEALFQLALTKGKLTGPGLDDALVAAKFYQREAMARALLAKSAHDIEIQVPPERLRAYAGRYAEGSTVARFVVQDRALLHDGVPLTPIGKDRFRHVPRQLDFTFVRDANGAVESVQFEIRGRGEQELMKSKGRR